MMPIYYMGNTPKPFNALGLKKKLVPCLLHSKGFALLPLQCMMYKYICTLRTQGTCLIDVRNGVRVNRRMLARPTGCPYRVKLDACRVDFGRCVTRVTVMVCVHMICKGCLLG